MTQLTATVATSVQRVQASSVAVANHGASEQDGLKVRLWWWWGLGVTGDVLGVRRRPLRVYAVGRVGAGAAAIRRDLGRPPEVPEHLGVDMWSPFRVRDPCSGASRGCRRGCLRASHLRGLARTWHSSDGLCASLLPSDGVRECARLLRCRTCRVWHSHSRFFECHYPADACYGVAVLCVGAARAVLSKCLMSTVCD